MPWVRDWDGICNVYKKWDEAVATWTIEDLNPEDDQIAMDLMIEHMLEEALFCNRLGKNIINYEEVHILIYNMYVRVYM